MCNHAPPPFKTKERRVKWPKIIFVMVKWFTCIFYDFFNPVYVKMLRQYIIWRYFGNKMNIYDEWSISFNLSLDMGPDPI